MITGKPYTVYIYLYISSYKSEIFASMIGSCSISFLSQVFGQSRAKNDKGTHWGSKITLNYITLCLSKSFLFGLLFFTGGGGRKQRPRATARGKGKIFRRGPGDPLFPKRQREEKYIKIII